MGYTAVCLLVHLHTVYGNSIVQTSSRQRDSFTTQLCQHLVIKQSLSYENDWFKIQIIKQKILRHQK